MPTDKIYDVSFKDGFFLFVFFFLFQFAPMEFTDFHQNKFLTYQMLVNPEQVCVCVDLCLREICGQQRGKNDATEKNPNGPM